MDTSISLEPGTNITFKPTAQKQSAMLELRNEWNKEIIFKLRTTSVERYKMRPIYGRLRPGSTIPIKLVFLGFKRGQEIKRQVDRMSILMLRAPNFIYDAQKAWKEANESEASRKVVHIRFEDTSEGKKKSQDLSQTPPSLPNNDEVYPPVKAPTVTTMSPTTTHSTSPCNVKRKLEIQKTPSPPLPTPTPPTPKQALASPAEPKIRHPNDVTSILPPPGYTTTTTTTITTVCATSPSPGNGSRTLTTPAKVVSEPKKMPTPVTKPKPVLKTCDKCCSSASTSSSESPNSSGSSESEETETESERKRRMKRKQKRKERKKRSKKKKTKKRRCSKK
ncbi:hypothetical protein L596_022547 [Steinernema carpocapsae]|uniref:Major sperm protein n=1 Tax=Steinernema carpocapsae TaxID=34508 RepID=A0A4U5MM23_STECR|nr:hypothetical protein L596_022547 [Steinernema carpocapsae]